MGRQIIKYTFAGAALVIAVTHASELGSLFISGSRGFSTADRTLQGR